jgi:DnaJ homolog subfamily C member 3
MIISRLSSLVVVAATASILLAGAITVQDSAGGNDWKLDVDRANTLLTQGKYTDAISLYDEVIRIFSCLKATNSIEKDKKNYLSYYKRALSYLGLSRFHAAITDLNTVLEIQPDFSAALLRRGRILAWQGDFSNALKDLQKVPNQDDLVRHSQTFR